jgi:putative hemolysin
MNVTTLSIVVSLIVVNALYVAAEFAAVGARATRVEQLAMQGDRLARLLLPILRDAARLDRYIAACQIGITASSLILGAFGQATIGLALGASLVAYAGMEPVGAYALSATITLVGLTSTQVVFGELIPKTVALQYPVRTALITYLPMRWSLVLLAPFIDVLNGSGSLLLRLFGVTAAGSQRHVHSPQELDLLIRESREGGLLEDKDSERLRGALRLGHRRVRQVMVPRRRIASLDLAGPTEQLLSEAGASPFTRLPVHHGGLEGVRGYLHVKDVVVALAAGGDHTQLRSLVRPLLILPSSLTIDRAVTEMRDRRARIALLVDEYGEVEGLISLEDIIRELLGRLSDKGITGIGSEPTQLPDGRWRLAGRLPLDAAQAWAQTLLGRPLEPSTAETLAGWLIERLDAIPEGPCCLRTDGLLLEIEGMDGAAIDSVLVWPAATAGDIDA